MQGLAVITFPFQFKPRLDRSQQSKETPMFSEKLRAKSPASRTHISSPLPRSSLWPSHLTSSPTSLDFIDAPSSTSSSRLGYLSTSQFPFRVSHSWHPTISPCNDHPSTAKQHTGRLQSAIYTTKMGSSQQTTTQPTMVRLSRLFIAQSSRFSRPSAVPIPASGGSAHSKNLSCELSLRLTCCQ